MRSPIAALVFGCLAFALVPACKPKIPTINEPFAEAFERLDLGGDWHDTGKTFRVVDGRLTTQQAYNHPLWLRRKLPRDVQIDFDALSKSPAGDLKVELYGDGESFDPDGNRYDPTGYMIVFGGWHNSRSIISRLGEHDDAVKAAKDRQGNQPLVIPGRTYHFTITRQGGRIDWKLDGQPYLSWTDPDPLFGPGHEYFAINDWETEVYFDNLVIKKAP